jgi:hypothetical protein
VTCLALYLHPNPALRRGLVDGSVGQVVLKRRTCEECGGDGYFDQVDSRTTPQRVADLTCSKCDGRGWLPALVPESATPTQVREVGSPDLGWRAFEGDDETWSSLDLSDDFRCRTSLVPGRLGIVEYQWPGTEPRQVVSMVRPITERLEVVERYEGGTVIQVNRHQRCLWRPGQMATDLPAECPADLQPGDVVLTLGAPEPLAEPITHSIHPTGRGTDGPDWAPLAVEAGSVEEVETS